MQEYEEKTFKHRKPCERYLKTGWCMHINDASVRKFKTEIQELEEFIAKFSSEHKVGFNPPNDFLPTMNCGVSPLNKT